MEKKFTILNVSCSLPLPAFEHIGTLNIQRQSGMRSKTKLMSLPVKDRSLSVKVIFYMTNITGLPAIIL